MKTITTVLAVAFVFFFLASLAVLLFVRRRRRRDAVVSTATSGDSHYSKDSFLLFNLCSQIQNQSRVEPSGEMNRQRLSPEHYSGGQEEAEEFQFERWKRMCGGPSRALYTIDEGTEKGTTPFATPAVASPALCTPAASPDRRRWAFEAGMATTAVQN